LNQYIFRELMDRRLFYSFIWCGWFGLVYIRVPPAYFSFFACAHVHCVVCVTNTLYLI
jgi:hypothetical protein